MSYSKMYIAVLDDAPDYMVPTLVAHSVLNAHLAFQHSPEYQEWLTNSFRKVVVRVDQNVFDKIASRFYCHKGHENTICDAKPSCLVLVPMMTHEVTPIISFAKLWKPKEV